MDNETLNLKIVKFTLQPIIENALSHGILLVDYPCTLTINACVKDDCLIVKVKNEGKLISDERILEINEMLSKSPIKIKEGKTIGISNVNQRIKLVCGNDYGCYLKKDNNTMSTIIKFPVMNDEII